MPRDCPGMGGGDVEALIWLAHYNLQSQPEAIGTIELYRQKGGKNLIINIASGGKRVLSWCLNIFVYDCRYTATIREKTH